MKCPMQSPIESDVLAVVATKLLDAEWHRRWVDKLPDDEAHLLAHTAHVAEPLGSSVGALRRDGMSYSDIIRAFKLSCSMLETAEEEARRELRGEPS